MFDASFGLVCLLLAAVSLVGSRIWFSRQPTTSGSADIWAMITATSCTGLFAIGTAEMIVFVISASGLWAWIDGAVVAVGLVAIVAISFQVANRMHTGSAIPAAPA